MDKYCFISYLNGNLVLVTFYEWKALSYRLFAPWNNTSKEIREVKLSLFIVEEGLSIESPGMLKSLI